VAINYMIMYTVVIGSFKKGKKVRLKIHGMNKCNTWSKINNNNNNKILKKKPRKF
jgi:hypothetical protein